MGIKDKAQSFIDYIKDDSGIGFFEKFLSVWVILCIIIGAVIGYFVPEIGVGIEKASAYQINFPIAILIWVMIFPALVQVDLTTLRSIKQYPKALLLTTSVNYLIQPFTMFGLALLFFNVFYKGLLSIEERQQYIAGLIMLGAAPCTAMVFVWSFLTKGDATYTLVQVASNDIILVIVYAPIVGALIGASNIPIPWATVILSTCVFIVVPFLICMVVRFLLLRYKGPEFITEKLLPPMKPITQIALLAMLVLIFIGQGEKIVQNPLHVVLIAVPLLAQTIIIFLISYFLSYVFKIPFRYSAPGALIATSNFFELAVAVAISLYGISSGAALATVVGVLVEVPAMLLLVWICNHTRHWFEKFEPLRDSSSTQLEEVKSEEEKQQQQQQQPENREQDNQVQ